MKHAAEFSLALAAALLVPAARAGEAPPAEPMAGKLPPAKEIVETFVKAIGGREAWLRHRSLHAKGILDIPANGLKGSVEIFMAAPSNHLVRADSPDLGLLHQSGFDGRVGWEVEPAVGPRLLAGQELEQLRAESDFRGVLHDPKQFQTMEAIEAVSFDDRPCYKVRFVRMNGDEFFEYFETATGLSAGRTSKISTPVGQLPMTQTTSAYKKVGDILMPTKIVQKTPGLEQTVTLNVIEFDRVNESVFVPPQQIRALMRK
jgi:hypothetical protein